MSSDNLSVGTSPHSPGALPGQSVRRLNRLPLLFILGALMIALAVLSWVVYQRAQARQQVEQEQRVIQPQDMGHVVDQLTAGYEEGGLITPSSPEEKPEPEVTEVKVEEVVVVPETVKPIPEPRATAPKVAQPETPSLSPEEQAALQRYAQIRQRMFKQAFQAMVAPTGVSESVSFGELAGGKGNIPVVGGDSEIEQIATRVQQHRGREAMLRRQLQSFSVAPVASSLLEGLVGHVPVQADYRVVQRQGGISGVGGSQEAFTYSTERRQQPRSAPELRVGTLIPAVMISGINSDLPGEVLAQVTEAVRDSRSGRYVLIPQGAKLVGRYVSGIQEGQERVLVAWYRVNFPDGSFLNLEAMNGVDQAGYSGFHDKVNKHTFEKFKEATLLSLISGGVQLSQTNSDEASRQLAAALGQQWGTVGEEVVKRKLERSPTIEVRPGYRFNVFINRDLVLEVY